MERIFIVALVMTYIVFIIPMAFAIGRLQNKVDKLESDD